MRLPVPVLRQNDCTYRQTFIQSVRHHVSFLNLTGATKFQRKLIGGCVKGKGKGKERCIHLK